MSYAIFSKYLPTYNINNNINFILVNKIHTIISTNYYIKYVGTVFSNPGSSP